MTTVKANSAKATAETTSIDNVISVAQWAETSAIARDGMFKCARDLAEISRVAGQAVIGGYADYGNEVRDIGSTCAKAMISGLTDERSASAKVEESASDMMKQVQRLMDANTQLAERQINAACEAFTALSALPSCILGSLDGK
ncbi:hypothetical protein [Paramagnetospirillum magneticum]|uniref:Phasin domain-containing protein n=1 Tax=Paramagnetospirillum magneticum (strain ATCC 700264 / AMB-1) TaxID=342108 RepID=Q2W109_PARM1|nr:hypothetical protein [Paramagnetospirillum magneticum]BAE52466.1 hypothetical protein amb3662 [Paramagnetospirillum magneticum AMB-1]